MVRSNEAGLARHPGASASRRSHEIMMSEQEISRTAVGSYRVELEFQVDAQAEQAAPLYHIVVQHYSANFIYVMVSSPSAGPVYQAQSIATSLPSPSPSTSASPSSPISTSPLSSSLRSANRSISICASISLFVLGPPPFSVFSINGPSA
jgi:hypothetical protein